MTLISDSEMLALQQVAESGMVTTAYVYSQTLVQTDDGQETTFPASPSFSVKSWLYNQTGGSTVISVLDGGGGISQQWRLMVPIGTNIQGGDKVVVASESYIVQYTTDGETYPPVMRCYLRTIE